MDSKPNIVMRDNFFKDFKESNPSLILGLIIISIGLYIINWIYLISKDFESLDDEAPEPNRGAALMMIIPFGWFFIIFTLKEIIFKGTYILVLGIIEIVVWGLIIFLILKFLYDFCKTYGKITKTNHFFWFGFFFLGLIGIVATTLGHYFVSPLIFFLFIVVPAMQAELNTVYKTHFLRRKKDTYYS